MIAIIRRLSRATGIRFVSATFRTPTTTVPSDGRARERALSDLRTLHARKPLIDSCKPLAETWRKDLSNPVWGSASSIGGQRSPGNFFLPRCRFPITAPPSSSSILRAEGWQAAAGPAAD